MPGRPDGSGNHSYSLLGFIQLKLGFKVVNSNTDKIYSQTEYSNKKQ